MIWRLETFQTFDWSDKATVFFKMYFFPNCEFIKNCVLKCSVIRRLFYWGYFHLKRLPAFLALSARVTSVIQNKNNPNLTLHIYTLSDVRCMRDWAATQLDALSDGLDLKSKWLDWKQHNFGKKTESWDGYSLSFSQYMNVWTMKICIWWALWLEWVCTQCAAIDHTAGPNHYPHYAY